jgi:multicomponent Na+:H+ antiporter subunit E
MVLHIVWLTAIWLLLTGQFTLANLVLGLLLSSGMLLLYAQRNPLKRQRNWNVRRVYQAVALTGLFLYEVVASGISVAIAILNPKMRLRSGIVAIPVANQSPLGVMILANLITMTPGTLSLYVDEEKQLLYVHAMQIEDTETFRQTTLTTFANRVQEVLQ